MVTLGNREYKLWFVVFSLSILFHIFIHCKVVEQVCIHFIVVSDLTFATVFSGIISNFACIVITDGSSCQICMVESGSVQAKETKRTHATHFHYTNNDIYSLCHIEYIKVCFYYNLQGKRYIIYVLGIPSESLLLFHLIFLFLHQCDCIDLPVDFEKLK